MAIDEKKLIDAICYKEAEMPNAPIEFAIAFGYVVTLIEEQPKISLENKTSDWIPVTGGGLPDEAGWYYVTRQLDGLEPDTCSYYWTGNHFKGAMAKIIAWQPRPEPYKGE